MVVVVVMVVEVVDDGEEGSKWIGRELTPHIYTSAVVTVVPYIHLELGSLGRAIHSQPLRVTLEK